MHPFYPFIWPPVLILQFVMSSYLSEVHLPLHIKSSDIFFFYLSVGTVLFQTDRDSLSYHFFLIFKYIGILVKFKVVVEEIIHKFIRNFCLVDDCSLECCGRKLGAVISLAF